MLSSERYLQALLANPIVIAVPTACEIVLEALRFKTGMYPFLSTLMIPRRMCQRNTMAYLGDSKIHFYDLESRRIIIRNFIKIKKHRESNFQLLSLGDKVAFLARKTKRRCFYGVHKCRPQVVQILNEDKSVTCLYEVCHLKKMPMALFYVNNQIHNICHSTTGGRVVEQDVFKITLLE